MVPIRDFLVLFIFIGLEGLSILPDGRISILEVLGITCRRRRC